MRIGIIIGRIGGIDGVALETEKWITVLKRLGYEIFVIAGKLESDIDNVTIVPELDFHHPLTIREQKDAYFVQRVKNETIQSRIETPASYMEKEILTWIVKNKIDLLLSENASALPCHLSLGLAIKRVAELTGIPMVTHDHDFSWERGDRYKTKSPYVKKIMDSCFPINLPNVKHAVINTPAKHDLKKRFGINATVVPNVMDFDIPYARPDSYNSTLRQSLKIKETDILLFQITRIVRRKGIEVAIKLVQELDDPQVKLIVTGCSTDDYNGEYYGELFDEIEKYGIHDQVLFAADKFHNERMIGNELTSSLSASKIKKAPKHKKIYSIEDAYSHADICTYFSTYEGFGNAFVETVLAKKPIFVNNYKPVYWPEIGSKGFEAVMLNDNKLTNKALMQMKDVIYNPKRAREIAEHNFSLGKELFSYDVLEEILGKLFNKF